jgi:hypothetical protein
MQRTKTHYSESFHSSNTWSAESPDKRLQGLLFNLRWLSTARVSYPRKITRNITFNRFQGLSIEIIEEKNHEKVIHSQFISPCFTSKTHHFGRTQVALINI